MAAATVMLWTAGDVMLRTATCWCKQRRVGANLHNVGLTPAAAMMQNDMRSHAQFSATRNASTIIARANKLSRVAILHSA
jgi:hypothetical protein